MPNEFISEENYRANRDRQNEVNGGVLDELRKMGVTDTSELRLEYFFYTNAKQKAKPLADSLKQLYYSVEYRTAATSKDEFVITGWSSKMKIDQRTVSEWSVKMCDIGFKFDCDFDGWGTSPDGGESKKELHYKEIP